MRSEVNCEAGQLRGFERTSVALLLKSTGTNGCRGLSGAGMNCSACGNALVGLGINTIPDGGVAGATGNNSYMSAF